MRDEHPLQIGAEALTKENIVHGRFIIQCSSCLCGSFRWRRLRS